MDEMGLRPAVLIPMRVGMGERADADADYGVSSAVKTTLTCEGFFHSGVSIICPTYSRLGAGAVASHLTEALKSLKEVVKGTKGTAKDEGRAFFSEILPLKIITF